jgi:H+/gluconate symporter-like permease
VKYGRIKRQKKRQQEEQQDKKKTKNRTEEFHAFFQAIVVPVIMDIMWTDRCIDRNSPVLGGRIVAEYDSLTKKIMQLYTTMKEMVLL